MVKIVLGIMQERTASSSMCTVQMPRYPLPQLYLVPVNPRVSRSTDSNRVSGLSSTIHSSPFTDIVIEAISLLHFFFDVNISPPE
jgi:hypothetical protein